MPAHVTHALTHAVGVIYGWPALLLVLKDEGVYSELCDEGEVPTLYLCVCARCVFVCGACGRAAHVGCSSHSRQTTCTEQDLRLNLVFVCGVVANAGSGLPLGLIVDRCVLVLCVSLCVFLVLGVRAVLARVCVCVCVCARVCVCVCALCRTVVSVCLSVYHKIVLTTNTHAQQGTSRTERFGVCCFLLWVCAVWRSKQQKF